MATNRLMAMLDENTVPVGMQCFTGDHTLIEVLGRTGFDYVWLDSEHCATNPRALEDTIRTAEAAGLTSLVRIPEPGDVTAGRRALEAGAHGLIVPMARSAAQIRELLDFMLYPPNGKRGICPAYRAAGYSIRSFGEHAADNDANLFVIPLIETLDALEDIDAICAIEQVRVLCFAAGELAFAMGEGANMHSSTKVRDAYARVKEAAARHGVVLMGGPILNPTHDTCAKALEDGIRVFCLGIDIMAFRGVCESTIAALESAVVGTAYSRPPAPVSGFPDHY
ncbi:HpcH/HpaI aldolase/citrate lyase family protein [Streptomyces sp. NPDC056405]|uniref:HpcH/HpaI aldolase family protein n=1 Tax=Streptomyces sp. NPDC056405 TaxID=3345811 RepID=UPI0035E176BB